LQAEVLAVAEQPVVAEQAVLSAAQRLLLQI
jgi:hypothetical protein